MSTIQERLARDIAAVTGGVVVTESDVRDAREAVDARIAVQQQRSRRRTVAAVAAAAVVIPVMGFAAFQQWGDGQDAAPANPEPSVSADPNGEFLTGEAPTPELLEGAWRVDNGTLLVRFSAPDKVSFDNAGRLFRDPAATGTYALEGDRIGVELDTGSAMCPGQSLEMRAVIAAAGIAHVMHSQSAAGDCPELLPGTLWTLEQVLPSSSSVADLRFSEDPGWQPLSDPVPDGDWVAEGGGYVLELDAGGSYYVADESGAPVDRGRWAQRNRDLTLTSSGASVECSAGDRLAWTDLEQVNPGTPGIRGTVRENTCGAAWTPKAWILLPDAG